MTISKTSFKTVLFISALPFVSLAKAPSFTGVYVGGSVAYRSFETIINNNNQVTSSNYKFKGNSTLFEGLVGKGKSWKRLYVGYEFSTGFNTGKATSNAAPSMRVNNNWQFGLAARIGAPIPESSFMPYLGLGVEYRQMSFKSTTSTSSFYDFSLGPLVGFEMLLDDTWRMRLEGAYQITVHNTNLPAQYKFKESPSSFILKGSLIYKIPRTD